MQINGRLLFANFSSFLLGTLIARGLSAVSLIIIARQIQPEGFAKYGPTISLVTLTNILFTIGVDQWLLHQGSLEKENLHKYTTAALTIKFTLGLLWLFGFLICQRFLNQETFPSDLVMWATITVLLEQISMTTWIAMKVSLRNELSSILLVLLQVIFFICTLYFRTQNSTNPTHYVQGKFIAAFITAIVSLIVYNQIYKIEFSLSALKTTLKAAPPFGLSTGLSSLYLQADVTIIAHFLGTEASGIYSPASSILTILFTIPLAIYSVLVPTINYSDSESKSLLQKIYIGVIINGLLISLLLSLFAEPILTLIVGDTYSKSAIIISTLSWIFALRSISYISAALIVTRNLQNYRVFVQFIVAVLNVGLSIYVVKNVQSETAILYVAYVYLLSETMLTLGYSLILRVFNPQKHN